jgi:hypothetical protein
MNDFDLYETVVPLKKENEPKANGTLSLMYGLNNGNFLGAVQEQATLGPAHVANERAKLARTDEMQLLKEATLNLAKEQNTLGVETALNELRQLATPKAPSFHDDVVDSVAPEIEVAMIKSGKGLDEINRRTLQLKNDVALRTLLEVNIDSLDERGIANQLIRDVTGFTTAQDWGRLSPVVNEMLEANGFTGSRALTFATAAENTRTLLRNIPSEDVGKILNTITSKLIPVLGEGGTRRFLTAISQQLTLDPISEGAFGSLDVLMLTGIAKAGIRASLKASNGVSIGKTIGAGDAVAADLATTIEHGSGILNASKKEAVDAAMSSRTLLSSELDGAVPEVQAALRKRLETTLKDLDNSMYTGGANLDEIMASKARLERIYNKEANPSIVSSKVTPDVQVGKLNVDVLYGDANGNAFSTAEEALDYYKQWKRGELEVVPVNGTTKDNLAVLEQVNNKLSNLTNEINQSKYTPILSTSNNLIDLKRESPFFGYAPIQTGDASRLIPAARAVTETRPLLNDVWASVRNTVFLKERLVIDNLIETIPKQTKVVISEGAGRSHYMPASDTMVLFGGNKDMNTFTHEIIHAVTSNKIAFGRKNPSSSIGKVVSNMDNLRATVISNIGKVKDKQLKQDLEYLTKDLEEFSTAGLWSINQLPKVAAFLDGIKYKNTTLLSELWTSFKDLLGFGKKDTALSEWFGITEELSKQGLRVQLPKTIEVGNNVFTNPSVLRTYPKHGEVVVNKHVDNLFKQFEETVAQRIELDPMFSPASEGFYVRQKVDMPVFLEDIGKISQDELDKMHIALGKINPRLASVDSIYSPALTSMYKRTKYGKVYSDFIKTSFDRLNGESIDKVNRALVHTEKLKRDMTVFELGENGVKTANEQEAYYAFRTMRNMQYYYKNKEAVNALTARGYHNVFIGLDELGQFTGPAKKRNLEDFMYKNVYDVDNNKMVTVTLDNVAELDSRGLQIYEYAKAQQVQGRRGHITVVAVPPNKLRVGDVSSVVGRVDGAYSRIYTEEYFIKIKGKQLVNDVEEEMEYAFRTAASEKDAAAYVKGMNSLLDSRKGLRIITTADVSKALGMFEKEAEKLATDLNNGVFDGARAKFNYTRLDDNFFRDTTGIGSDDMSGGKVFWSERTEQGVKSISTGSSDLEIQGPLQSLEAEISNTSRFTAINEWRRNAIQRWYNTFEDVISASDKLNTKTAEDVFFNVVNNAKGYALTDEFPRQMLTTKDFIINQLAVKTTDEKLIQHAVNTITNNVVPTAFSHVGQVLRKANVLEWAKGVNSTLMLGMFAPAQLAVQASGMLLAATMSPLHGVKAAFSIRPILIALTSDNPTVWNKVHRWASVAKYTGMDMSEFSRVAAAIKRVGLLDNIGASSVYNSGEGSVNIFAKNQNRFKQAQMMFFNTGEEINRVGAFEIARREFIARNPGLNWESNTALETIVQRADDLSMNMSQVNEARFSKGILGIPLQFLQHNIRLGTNIFAAMSGLVGKKSPTLTTKEAFQLTLGSYLLYGISNNATPDFIEDWLGEKLNGTLSEQQKQYLTQGLLAGIIATVGEELTGQRTNIALGTRLSSLQWYEDLGDAVYGLFKGEKVDIAKLAGPTGSTLKSILEIPAIFTDYINKDEFSLADFGRTLSTLGATMVSSWRGIDKAYWAYHANGMVLNKRGDPQAVLTTPEMIFQALGFQSTEAYESSTVFKTNQDYNNTMKRYADAQMRLIGLARKAYLAGDIESMNANYRAASAITAPLPEADKKKIERMVRDSTSYDTVGREAFNKWATQMSSHKNRLLVTNPYGEVNGE